MLDDSLTFRDLVIRVAELVGTHSAPVAAGDTVGPPTDAYELDRTKRAINDGLDEMARSYKKWRVLRPVVNVALSAAAGVANIAGDIGRVRLNSAFLLIPLGQWNWKLANSTGYGGQLTMVPMARVLALAAHNTNQLGTPAFAAIGPVGPDQEQVGTRRGIELRVWPKPDQDYTLEGPARIQIPRLAEDGEYSPFGSQHDQTVISAAQWILQRTNPDLQVRQWYEDQFKQAMSKSIELDGELASASAGVGVDGGLRRDVPTRGEINWQVSTYNGVSV